MSRQIVPESLQPDLLIQNIARQLGVSADEEGAELFIRIPAKTGTGIISGIDFKNGVGLLLFHAKFKEDFSIRYKPRGMQPLRLMFSVESSGSMVFKSKELQFELDALKSALLSTNTKNEQEIFFKSGSGGLYCFLHIDRKTFTPRLAEAIGLLPSELKEVFEDRQGRRSFLYTGHCNLVIAECIQNIVQCGFTGAVRRVYFESLALEILSRHMRQFIDELSPNRSRKPLHKRDFHLIQQAKTRLLEDLANPPTIPELAQMVGTNENKLKSGFRLLYETSINKLLQDERLNKAMLLMADGAYPIKEVAKLVGYKHSAHFASKFKKKFGVLPYEYMKSLLKREG